MPGAQCLQQRADGLDLALELGPDGFVLERQHDRLAAGAKTARLELGGEHLGLGRQIAERPELGPAVAGGGRLVQIAAPVDLLVVVGEPDAEGIGRGRDLELHGTLRAQ